MSEAKDYGTLPEETEVLLTSNSTEVGDQDGYMNTDGSHMIGKAIQMTITVTCFFAVAIQIMPLIRKADYEVTLVHPPTAAPVSKEPNQIGPLFFEDALVDNFDENDTRKWSNTYFLSDTYFQGPGHPFFVILGGEGPAEGILYPFVSKGLAKAFGGMTVQTEHRFYGKSQPLGDNPSTEDLLKYFSPEQAYMDWVRLFRYLQREKGCSINRKSHKYCPIITIGGSYPGFLAAVFRLVHPDVVDIGYGSGAPLILNAQHLDKFDSNAYFAKVSQVAEAAYPGCSLGVYSTLRDVNEELVNNENPKYYESFAKGLGICVETIPPYMKSNEVLGTELTQIVVSVAADMNMFYRGIHPENSLLFEFCEIFTDSRYASMQRLANYLKLLMSDSDYIESNPISFECYDMNSVMPYGPNATVSCADWTGCGPGITGQRWEFQICKDLIMATGFGANTMFYPPRNWTLEWLTGHCQARFGITPVPGRLNDMWHFDDLSDPDRASHILFVNGQNDGWIVGSFTTPPNPLIDIVTIPHGAHHTELGNKYPRPDDTPDVVEAQTKIEQIIGGWLADIRGD